MQEALWIVPRMSSPLKTPKLDSWGHPPTHALTCLHPIALTWPPTPPHAPHVFTIEVISRHVFMQMLFLHYFWNSCFVLYFSGMNCILINLLILNMEKITFTDLCQRILCLKNPYVLTLLYKDSKKLNPHKMNPMKWLQ